MALPARVQQGNRGMRQEVIVLQLDAQATAWLEKAIIHCCSTVY